MQQLHHAIARKEQELRVLREALRLLTPEAPAREGVSQSEKLSMAAARNALREAGRPLHVTELLEAMGASNTLKHRRNLASMLWTYMRAGKIDRVGPRTYAARTTPGVAAVTTSRDYVGRVRRIDPPGGGKLFEPIVMLRDRVVWRGVAVPTIDEARDIAQREARLCRRSGEPSVRHAEEAREARGETVVAVSRSAV